MTRVYEEIVDFIAAGSGPDQLVRFQPSQEARDRVADLLSRRDSLTRDEAADLDHYLEFEHIMRLVKRGRDKISAHEHLRASLPPSTG